MSTSRLLINEPPLMVLPSLAKEIGLNEAIILQQLHYWLENPKVGVIRDGCKWVFNTYEEWRDNFPFWSKATIQRAFSVLEEKGLIISKQFDVKKRDMTKFYRIDYDKLNGGDTLHHSNLIPSNTADCYDVNTETTPETTSKIISPKEPAIPPLPISEGKPPKAIPDPRSKHPAIMAFREVTEHYPNKGVYDEVIEKVGETPDMELLKRCRVEWLARGYNANSIKWLDWYKAGGISQNGYKSEGWVEVR